MCFTLNGLRCLDARNISMSGNVECKVVQDNPEEAVDFHISKAEQLVEPPLPYSRPVIYQRHLRSRRNTTSKDEAKSPPCSTKKGEEENQKVFATRLKATKTVGIKVTKVKKKNSNPKANTRHSKRIRRKVAKKNTNRDDADSKDEDWNPEDNDNDCSESEEEDEGDSWKPCGKSVSKGKKKSKKKLGGEESNMKSGKSERRSLSHLILIEDKEDGTRCYKCSLCNRSLDILRSMYQHLRDHKNKEQYFKCNICSKEFAYEGGLTLHMRLHGEVDENLFKCSKCNRKFLRKCDLQKHEVRHSISFLCRYCKETFKREALRVEHEKRHTNEKKYQCDICELFFFDTAQLNQHRLRHIRKERFNCEFCDKSYKDSSTLKMHKRKHHTKENLHHCDHCEKAYASMFQLRTHLKSHYPEREKRYECKSCDKKYLRKGSLVLHKKIVHENLPPPKKVKSHACEICKQKFHWKAHLLHHLQENLPERPFECTACSKAFRTKDKLRNHSRRHKEGRAQTRRPFVCNLRGCRQTWQSFSTKLALATHQQKEHTEGDTDEEKCHQCPNCSKQTRLILRAEYRLGHNPHVKGYLCELCGDVLTSEDDLLNHISEMHC